MLRSERLASCLAGALAATCLFVLTGQTKKLSGPDILNHFPKVVRAAGFQIWSDGSVAADVGTELSRIKGLESRIVGLESDLAALHKSGQAPASAKPGILPSEAVAEFSQTYIAFTKTWTDIAVLKRSDGIKGPSKADLEMANSLLLEQRSRWQKLLDLAKNLPPSHSQWRTAIETCARTIGVPSNEVGIGFDPPILPRSK